MPLVNMVTIDYNINLQLHRHESGQQSYATFSRAAASLQSTVYSDQLISIIEEIIPGSPAQRNSVSMSSLSQSFVTSYESPKYILSQS